MIYHAALAAAAVASLLSTSAGAQELVPAEITVRVVEDGPDADKLRLILDIDLNEGWKTYYRSPEGYETELAIHWSGEAADAGLDYEILWPEYEIFDFYGEAIKGYRQDVTIPVEVSWEDGARPDTLSFDLEAYFCSNLCVRKEIPYEISLTSHDLSLPWAN